MTKRYKSKTEMGRRQFIKTVGKAGLSAGLLRTSSLAAGMMLARSAVAQNATGVSRAVFVYIPGGTPFLDGNSLFNPSSNLVLPGASAAMEPIKNDCVFFSDAEVSGGGGHGFTQKTLGARGSNGSGSNTVDVRYADSSLGANMPFPQLLMGVQSTVGNEGFASQRQWNELAYQDNPIATFNRVFANAGSSSSGGSIDILRSQSVLDIQKAEIEALQSVLGQQENDRLESHLSSLETIENRLQSLDNGGGTDTSSFNPTNFAYDPADNSTFTQVSDLQMDLAVLALQAKQTNVISMMLGNHQSGHAIPDLPWTDTYHQSIHGAGERGIVPHTQTRNYLSARFTYLIERLKAERDEFGNSMLDSTLVVQVTDMADGDNHTGVSAPMVLAGGGSAINRGQVARCGEHTSIFDTMTEVLGVSGEVPEYANGPLTGIIS